jgi:site-specific recombinase XerD
LRQIWRWLVDAREITGLASLGRSDLQAYIDARLRLGTAVSTINRDLRDLWAFLRFLAARDQPIAPDVFRVPRLKEGSRLPRFLTEAEYQRLKAKILEETAARTRDDRLDRAVFYVLAHGGLRLGELCDLSVSDVDLTRRRLMVREGKGKKDRSVPLSEPSVSALRAYLGVRGPALSDHLFVFRQRMIKPDLVRRRLRRYGEDVGVHVSPHRLRHTLATRLVNAGMDIVSIRNLLGHEKLSTTMIYARMHDATVDRHFRDAIARLESSAHPSIIIGPADREDHRRAHLCLPVSVSNCV